MDPKDINKTNFCNAQVENIISDDLKKYILKDIETRTNTKFNSRYAKIYNDQYARNLKNPHIACLKTSGSPYTLYLTQINNNNYSLLIDKKINNGYSYPKMFVVNFKFDSDLYKGSLFETELIRDKNNEWELMICDILYYKNEIYYKKVNIIDRINKINNMLSEEYNSNDNSICKLFVKKYFEICDIGKIFTTFVPTLNYNIRGIYFIPINIKYSNLLYLIKKQDDFNISKNKNFNFKILKHSKPEIFELYLKNDSGFQKIDYAYIPDISTSRKINDLFDQESDDDIIVECEYVDVFKKWKPLKKTNLLIDNIKDFEFNYK